MCVRVVYTIRGSTLWLSSRVRNVDDWRWWLGYVEIFEFSFFRKIGQMLSCCPFVYCNIFIFRTTLFHHLIYCALIFRKMLIVYHYLYNFLRIDDVSNKSEYLFIYLIGEFWLNQISLHHFVGKFICKLWCIYSTTVIINIYIILINESLVVSWTHL